MAQSVETGMNMHPRTTNMAPCPTLAPHPALWGLKPRSYPPELPMIHIMQIPPPLPTKKEKFHVRQLQEIEQRMKEKFAAAHLKAKDACRCREAASAAVAELVLLVSSKT